MDIFRGKNFCVLKRGICALRSTAMDVLSLCLSFMKRFSTSTFLSFSLCLVRGFSWSPYWTDPFMFELEHHEKIGWRLDSTIT